MSEAQSQGQATSEAQGTQGEGQNAETPQEGRTFSQADLRKIAANEKREGKQAAINDLLQKTGAESVDDLLSAYSEYQGIQEAVTTEADKAQKAREKAEARAQAAEERYQGTLKTYALRDAFRDAGINPERLKAAMRLAETDALEIDSEGNVSGVEEVVEAVKEEAAEFFSGAQERPRVNAPQTNGSTNGQLRVTHTDPMQGLANDILNVIERQ